MEKVNGQNRTKLSGTGSDGKDSLVEYIYYLIWKNSKSFGKGRPEL
jgi:hypothetical protein